ncbi:hypothetical protein D4764_17G0002320, partial [Takifugu flavidus]
MFYSEDLERCGLDVSEVSVYSGVCTEIFRERVRALMKSLKSENGHLDLFVRFLHGLSLESNQRILGGLLDQRNSHPETIQKVLNNLKEDQSVHQEIQEFLKSGEISERRLSEIHCSALAYLLQTSEEGQRRLIPAVRNCRKF